MSDLSQPIIPKRKRGRPRKVPEDLVALNEAPELVALNRSLRAAHERESMIAIDEETHVDLPEPQPMKYVPYQPEVITHINTSGLDLTDIAKKTPEPFVPSTNTPYNEPADPMPMSYEPTSNYASYPPLSHLDLPSQPSAEDVKKRKVLLSKINRYKNSFDVLKSVLIDESASMDDLEGKLEDMRLMISTKNSHTIFKTCYVTGVKAVEVIGGKTGAKLYGLADLVNKSPEIDSILREIECEIDILNNVSPTNRLIIATAGCAIACDTINRRSEILQSFTKGSVNATVNDQYKDL